MGGALTTTVAAVALASRSGAVLLVAMTLVSACGADTPDGVAAPGLDGAPREITLEAPPLPTTAAPASDSTTADSTTAAPASDSTTADSTTGDVSETEPDPSTSAPTSTTEASVPPETTPDAAAEAPATTVDDPFLRRGDEGPAVVSLQQRLIALEYLAPGGDTGVFDGATADALIDFQAQYGLVVDGIFGPESDRALNAAAASVTDG